MGRRIRDSLLLALACVLLLLPAVLWRSLEGMEYRTALFVRQMLSGGPTLIPQLYGLPYYDYPPLYFLLASLVPAAGAGGLLPLAMPGILSAALTVLVTSLFASRVRRSAGWMAGLALLSTPIFFTCGSRAIVDMMLALFVTLCLVAYYLYLATGKPSMFVLACAGLAGGVLTKGPVGAVLPLCVIAIYLVARRRLGQLLRAFLSLGLFLLVFAAVVAGAVAISEGGQTLRALIDAQVLDRIADEANKPRLYYVGVFFGGLAPWSFCAFIQLFRRGGGREEEDACLFSKIWLLATFVIFTLASVKHTRYLLPAAPPVAILCAFFWNGVFGRGGEASRRGLLKWVRRLCVACLAAGAAALLVFPVWLPCASQPFTWVLLPIIVAAIVFATRGPAGTPRGVFSVLAATLALGFLVYCQYAMPSIDRKTESRHFVLAAEAAADGRRVVFFDTNRDKYGLRYAYWSGREGDLAFAETIEDFERHLLRGEPVIAVAPERREELVRSVLGDGARAVARGSLEKRDFVAFEINAPPLRDTFPAMPFPYQPAMQ